MELTGRRVSGREPPPIAAALAYVRRGWAVFPCHSPLGAGCSCGDAGCASPAKHPRTSRGLHDASTRHEVVERWWHRWPAANVAIRTGSHSGVVVLDVDPPHGGSESLRRLAHRHGALPATMAVHTGGGGMHLYFAHPGGTVRNSAGALGLGIDVRGDGGYVLAPPSVHASGGVYRWGPVPRPAPLPDWLRPLLQPPERPPTPPPVERFHTGSSAWARAALTGELANVVAAAEGQRNHTLNRAAFALGQLVGGGHLDGDEVTSLLEQAGTGAGLAPKEARATVASGLSAGRQVPRHPPGRTSHEMTTPSAGIDLRTVELNPVRPLPASEGCEPPIAHVTGLALP